MPRKEQGWITFQTSDEERQILEDLCQSSQRTKTEILRELVRGLKQEAQPKQPPQSKLPPSELPRSQPQQAETATSPFARSQKMALKVSSRNVLKGRVKQVIVGSVNSEVTLEILHPVELVSVITRASAEELGLTTGAEAYAVIKSSDVVIAME